MCQPEVLLDDDGGGPHLEEAPPVVPAADAALEHLKRDISVKKNNPFFFKKIPGSFW